MKNEKKHFLMGTVKANKDTGTFSFIASTAAVDRQGESIIQSGWEVEKFLQNPVILWAHNYSELPIGKATKITIDETGLKVEGEWATAEQNPKAQQVRALYEGGFLSAVSVGFIPLERAGADYSIITRAELLEISVVPVPANPEALTLAKTTMALDTNLVKSMEDALKDDYHPEDDSVIEPADEVDEDTLVDEDIADTFEVDEEAKTWTLRKGDKVLATVKVADALLGQEVEVKEGRVLSAKNAEKITNVVGAMKEVSSALEELLAIADAPKAGAEDTEIKAGYVVISRVVLDEVRAQLRSVDKHNEIHLAVLNRVLGK